MTYLPTMGSIDSSSFNATKFPGVVYATNPTTHAAFKEMQKQLNRAAFAMNSSSRLAIDGKIGSDTLALAQAAGPYSPYSSPTSVADLAAMADVVSAGAKARADGKGVPQTVPAPRPAAPPMILDTKLNALTPAPGAASITDAFKNMSMPMMLALGAAAVGIGYYVTKKAK